MKFIEDYKAYIFQRIVGLNHAGENSFGNNLDTRFRTYFTFEANAITNRLAHFFFAKLCHAHGHGAGCQAPGFEHDNFLLLQPTFVQYL